MPSLRWLLVCVFLFSCSSEESGYSNAPLASTAQLPVPTFGPVVEVRNGPTPGSVELRANGTIDLASELIVERQLDDGSFEPLRNLDGDSMKLVTSCDHVFACGWSLNDGSVVLLQRLEGDSMKQLVAKLDDGSVVPLESLDQDSMKHVTSCGVSACVRIDERGLRPVPWTGMSCSSQCNHACDKNRWFGGGRFRFVVTSCDGKSRFEGPIFELPDTEPERIFPP